MNYILEWISLDKYLKGVVTPVPDGHFPNTLFIFT